MWRIWLLVVVALIVVLFLVLKRRGPGDPSYRPDDPRSQPGLGGPPGQWGPGGDGGGAG